MEAIELPPTRYRPYGNVTGNMNEEALEDTETTPDAKRLKVNLVAASSLKEVEPIMCSARPPATPTSSLETSRRQPYPYPCDDVAPSTRQH